jgi:hypothetical protein
MGVPFWDDVSWCDVKVADQPFLGSVEELVESVGRSAGGSGHDREHRAFIAVAATISARYGGSFPATSSSVSLHAWHRHRQA